MGRGRQRAKEKKVARKLKYYTPETDYEALQRELSGGKSSSQSEEDKYAELAKLYNAAYDDEEPLDDDDDDDYSMSTWSSGRR
ncbi:hypothetical protein BK816_00765 [Boudabousia tangfeifanii]|uniref:DUF3073 domain-containing protein n=1 Tax=Boudabousia tangfeifanii TaxID=1912795 RepID=A0A1D9MI77_9ACTO|nr:DUF3073 domain-containing protein [Boudabousia tangfeifanii]AOZ72007.1 hypothetical protein BK816_00765 [Boudabousia tangfeifanii]